MLALLAVLIAVGTWSSTAWGADRDRELLRRIGADWAQRRKTFSRVSYVAEGEVLFPKGCYNYLSEDERKVAGGGDLPAEDQTFPAHRTLYLDLDRGKARKEWSDYSFFVEVGKIMSSELANVFDGTAIRQRRLDRARVGIHVDLLIPKPEPFRHFFFDYSDYAILCAHGIVPRIGNMPVESIAAPPSTGDYAVHGDAVVAGRSTVVLRTPLAKGTAGTFAELYVDVDWQSAVVRWASYDNSMVVSRLDTAYSKSERGWWPHSWQLTNFQFGERDLNSVYRFHVSEFDDHPVIGSELFTEDPQPGMVVRDITSGTVYRYAGPDRPSEPLGNQPLTAEDRGHSAFWTVGAGIAALILVAAICIWLKTRTSEGGGRP